MKIAIHLAVACDVFLNVSLCCPFSPRDVLDEIWDLIRSVSEDFPTYFYIVGILNMPVRIYTEDMLMKTRKKLHLFGS